MICKLAQYVKHEYQLGGEMYINRSLSSAVKVNLYPFIKRSSLACD